MMESKYAAQLRRFDGQRYRPFCIDPAAGLYYVFDSVHSWIEPPPGLVNLSFDQACRSAIKLNEDDMRSWRERRGRQ